MELKFLDDNAYLSCYKVIGVFTDRNKDFVVYEDSKKDVFASKYLLSGSNVVLLPIDDDREWDLVDRYLEKLV